MRLLAWGLLFAGVVSTALADPAATIQEAHGRRMRVNRVGMSVLGGWAIANIGVGTAVALAAADPVVAAMGEMSAGWNVVNLALAVGGLAGSGALGRAGTPPAETVEGEIAAQHRIEKILLFNGGLDVGYMAAGLWMMTAARVPDLQLPVAVTPDRLRGWGAALIVQGGALFIFDLAMAAIHSRNRPWAVARNDAP